MYNLLNSKPANNRFSSQQQTEVMQIISYHLILLDSRV